MAVGSARAIPYLPVIQAFTPPPARFDARIRTAPMTSLDTAAHVTRSAHDWSDRLAAPAAALLGALGAWNDARVTRRTLSRLSARELDDIGLCRGDIETIARRGR